MITTILNGYLVFCAVISIIILLLWVIIYLTDTDVRAEEILSFKGSVKMTGECFINPFLMLWNNCYIFYYCMAFLYTVRQFNIEMKKANESLNKCLDDIGIDEHFESEPVVHNSKLHRFWKYIFKN